MASTTCADMPELISLVASNIILSESSVSIYSTISRQWRSAIERHTFSSIHLNQARLSDFARIVTGTRREAVRRLEFDIVLEPYTTDVRGQFETPEEQERNDEVFTEAMKTLFGHLSAWRLEDAFQKGIELSLKGYSPSDPSRMEQQALMRRLGRARHYIDGRDLLDRRFGSSFLRLLPNIAGDSKQEKPLPFVSIITKLTIGKFGYNGARNLRDFWPASVCLVASYLPRLCEMEVILRDTEKKDLALRKRARDDFAESFTWLPLSVSVFDLGYPYDPPSDQTFSPPDMTTDGSDLFSISLRRFSQQLTCLTTGRMVLSSEFFLPSKSDLTAQNAPYWPHLSVLAISYAPVTPSGEWLFKRDPATEVGDDVIEGRNLFDHMDEDELPSREYWKTDIFREVPDKRLMNDFYLAAGHAVVEMPRLRDMILVAASVRPRHSLEFKVVDSKATLTLCSTPRFEPEETVLEVWREAARRNTGLELMVSYLTEGDMWPDYPTY